MNMMQIAGQAKKPSTRRYAIGATVVGLAVVAAANSVFSVQPSERAGVRRFGTVTTPTPIQPGGPYFKMPFVDAVDKVQVSLATVHIKPFQVVTVDNQRITLDTNITYSIPNEAVFHLLYNVGRSGDRDIADSIEPVVRDRVGRVFSSKNTNFIAPEREKIQAEVTRVVHDELNRLFKINIESLQIAQITFSDAFNASNDTAVLEKNKAVAAENRVRTIELEARQKVAEAEGAAKKAVAEAEGANKSAIIKADASARTVELAAQAEAHRLGLQSKAQAEAALITAEADGKARELRGKGEGASLAAIIAALGSTDKYIAMLQAQAQNRWNGAVPQMVLGGAGSGPSPILPLMLPSTPVGAAAGPTPVEAVAPARPQ